MSTGTGFEEYLASKKIDSEAFRKAEPDLWKNWKSEFEQIHPTSFTMQKLNLINAIRRKYHLVGVPPSQVPDRAAPPSPSAVRPGKPVISPKPKTEL